MFDPGEYIRQIASHYPDSDSIRRVLGFAETDLLHIDIEGKPLNIWFEALREVQQQNKLEKFLEIVATEYPVLQIEQEDMGKLKDFLEKDVVTENPKKKNSFPYILIGISVLLLIFLIILLTGKNRSHKNITVQVHERGEEIRLITSGKMTIYSLSGNQSHDFDIDQKGLMTIKQPESWMYRDKVRIRFDGIANDSLSLFPVDSIIQLVAGDTTRIEVKMEKKNAFPVHTFIRLVYNNNKFEFPADASVLMLKKYIMSIFDSKTGLPADRQIFLYAGKEWGNDIHLSEIPWTEDRNVLLKYRLSTPVEYSSVSIHLDGIDMQGGLAFLNEEPGEIMTQTGKNTIMKFPKLFGGSELKIFFKDTMLLMPLTTGYSDSGKFYNRSDFGKYLQPIQRKVK